MFFLHLHLYWYFSKFTFLIEAFLIWCYLEIYANVLLSSILCKWSPQQLPAGVIRVWSRLIQLHNFTCYTYYMVDPIWKDHISYDAIFVFVSTQEKGAKNDESSLWEQRKVFATKKKLCRRGNLLILYFAVQLHHDLQYCIVR